VAHTREAETNLDPRLIPHHHPKLGATRWKSCMISTERLCDKSRPGCLTRELDRATW
jgi:hypothetical protein